MIHRAIDFIKDELNAYIKIKDKAFFDDKEVAVYVKNIAQDGNLEFQTSSNNENEHKIILFLINLEEERLMDKYKFVNKRVENRIQKQNPPVYLNLFLMFSGYSKTDYAAAMKNISFVISFFQQNRAFSHLNYPQLNKDAQPWERIEKLYFDLYNISLEQIYNLWSAIGTKSMPSVVYRIRLLMFNDGEITSESPRIEEAELYEK